MHNLTSFFLFLGFAILAVSYAVVQLKSGESLQWVGEWVTKDRHPLLFWGNVVGSAMAGLFALVVSLFLLLG